LIPALYLKLWPDSTGPATSAARPPAPVPVTVGAEIGANLATIKGLGTNDGLARVAGNRKLYLKLLQTTVALNQGDRGLAERLAHTLKGVAGNIGARSVQAAAGALEKLFVSGLTSRDRICAAPSRRPA
jgi:two-component system sensor histidine kinase/response regulator